MIVISEAKTEEEILRSVEDNVKAEEVRDSILSKAECCVNHLCGCRCGC